MHLWSDFFPQQFALQPAKTTFSIALCLPACNLTATGATFFNLTHLCPFLPASSKSVKNIYILSLIKSMDICVEENTQKSNFRILNTTLLLM